MRQHPDVLSEVATRAPREAIDYFAYGSNLCPEQMMRRTGVGAGQRAWLAGYRLAFNKRGWDGTGKANLVPRVQGRVWGVVYRCSPAALAVLDDYEGLSSGDYVRAPVHVELDAGPVRIPAITYLAGAAFLDDTLVPAPAYLARVLDGARHQGLPEVYQRLIQAAALPTRAGAGVLPQPGERWR